MRADNSHALKVAAQRRRAVTLERARAAIRRLEAAGNPVTFEGVAREAGVSRSWLYTEPDIRTAIDRLRATTAARTGATPVPTQQRTSDASLIRRLEVAHTRNRDLTQEVRRLREELARAHGELRVLRLTNADLGDRG